MDTAVVLAGLREYARKHFVPVMQLDAAELLADVTRQKQPARILEIGTSIGTSAIVMLSNCKANLVTIDINEDAVSRARDAIDRLGFAERVQFVLCDCCEALAYMDTKFDLILLDGPKGQYLHMLEDILRLLADGGVLFADNCAYHGLVAQDGTPMHKHRTIVTRLRQFISKVGALQGFEVSHIQKGDGIIIARKRA